MVKPHCLRRKQYEGYMKKAAAAFEKKMEQKLLKLATNQRSWNLSLDNQSGSSRRYDVSIWPRR